MIDPGSRIHKSALWCMEAGARREGVPMAEVTATEIDGHVRLTMPTPDGRVLGIEYEPEVAA